MKLASCGNPAKFVWQEIKDKVEVKIEEKKLIDLTKSSQEFMKSVGIAVVEDESNPGTVSVLVSGEKLWPSFVVPFKVKRVSGFVYKNKIRVSFLPVNEGVKTYEIEIDKTEKTMTVIEDISKVIKKHKIN
jgi:hypothetical protein